MVMRKTFDAQLQLDVPAHLDITFDSHSRHELEAILITLKHLYENPQVHKPILKLIAKDVLGDKDSDRGCPGLTYWEILVLASVRLGCDLDYDALADLANNHKKLRLLMGYGDWQEGKRFPYNTIRDNVVKLRTETIRQISNLIVAEGHRLKPEAIEKVRGDSVVVQTNIHYPTDSSLLVDGIRKMLSLLAALGKLFGVTTWQHDRTLLRPAKRLHRKIQKIAGSRKADNQEKLKPLYEQLIAEAVTLASQALTFKENLTVDTLKRKADKQKAEKLMEKLEAFLKATLAVVSQAERRVLAGEQVPNAEKIFSVFESHTELINRGKFPVPIEFGHRCLFIEDQIGFIVEHQVMDNGVTDEKMVVPTMTALQKRMKNRIKVASFDKGFYTPENVKELQKIVEVACLPKKGYLTGEAKRRESTSSFHKARRWHPGIESAIHALVSGNGLAVCRDKGETGYHRYVALGVLGRNLHTLGKILLNQARDERQPLRRAA
jgi:hypothetical protein